MRAIRAGSVGRLLKGQPISLETRVEELEAKIERRLDQIEQSIELFQDLILKLHEEREKLIKEQGIKQKIKEELYIPIKEEMEETAKLILEDDGHSVAKKQSDDLAKQRTIAWLRQKFGLPPKTYRGRQAKRAK
jgi:hypothetical protein